MALSAMLLGAMLQAYLAAKAALRWQEASARMDVDGYRALQLMVDDLRMAGFFAGADVNETAVPVTAPSCGAAPNWALALEPLAHFPAPQPAQGLAAMTCLPLAHLEPQSDLIAVRGVDGAPSWGPLASWVSRAPRDKQWYLGVGADSSGTFHWVEDGGAREPSDADVTNYWAFGARIYFVRRYSVTTSDRLPTLCVERLMGAQMRSECLVEGVERIRVEFAIDVNGDGVADRIARTPAEGFLHAVTHMHIYLLVRSVEALDGERMDRAFVLGGEAIDVAGDGHMRRTYTATVPLLNGQLSLTGQWAVVDRSSGA